MNEQILELADEAGIKFSSHWAHDGVDTAVITRRDLKEFAELIVRECTSKCEFVANMATITNTGEMARKTKATADSCATMIKQHFGVEE
jgi:hypothetical protein